MANDPAFLAGSIDAAAAEKMTRFVDLCDTFRLPVVNFVDNPGFLVGTEAEEQGTIRKGVRRSPPSIRRRSPWCSIIVRKAFGVAGAATEPHPLQPALRLALRRVGLAADRRRRRGRLQATAPGGRDPDKLRAELEEKLGSLRDPILTAEVFGVEEIIDPRDTRPLLVEFARRAHQIVMSETRGPKARGMRP